MNQTRHAWMVCLAGSVGVIVLATLTSAASGIEAPTTQRGEQVDVLHGVEVADPYRWLEEVDAPEVQAWVEAQNQVTRSSLDGLRSREYIAQRLTQLQDYPRHGVPTPKGGWLFYEKNDGLQNQSVLYKQHGLQGDPEILLDPNDLSKEGTVSLGALGYTHDGRMLAYGLQESGSDWEVILVKDVVTGDDLPDRLERCRFTEISWAADNSGFYYSRYPEDQEHFQKLYFHRLGEPQGADRLVYERPDDQNLGVSGLVSNDGRFLVIHVWNGTASENEIYLRRLDRPGAPIEPLFTGFKHNFAFIEAVGERLFFETDQDAPRRRVVAVDLNASRHELLSIVPQQEDVLKFARLIGDQLAVAYMHNAYDQLHMYSLQGELLQEVGTPTIGTINQIRGNPGSREMFVGFNSFLFPQQTYRYDFDDGRLALFQQAKIAFDAEPYVTRQVFYESKDRTKIPMFLIHRRGLSLDGDNPVLLYGYGGFNISITPRFSTSRLFWLEQGGILAMPTLRGGGEFGEEWHRAGMLEKKQNVFDDFIAAAEYLVGNGYTSPDRITIDGASNGGLLTAVCAVQRPDLFGVVLSRVPVIDMLRYHLFTIGSYWIPEYGDPENPEHFQFLYAYSPLHRVEQGTAFPAMLITTADTDTRVDPAHAKKFAAAVQHANTSENPILLRVETKAGHGAGKPTTKRIDEQADLYAFIMDRMGMEIVHHGKIVEETAR